MAEEPGTCLVTIGGAVELPGVVEVDRGVALRDIAMLSRPVEPAQAFLVGGYGGTWVGPEDFGTPYASMSLRTIGASAGVGIVVVLGAEACGVAESARIARFLADQSAGQCGPCVFGLPAVADSLEQLWRADVAKDQMHLLHRRLGEVAGRGACRHPDGVARLVTTALRVFAEDFDSHASGFPCRSANSPSVLAVPGLERKERLS
jgi:NADH:ubiquinone oxidoreductase subunit F (NADH-binding)